MTDLSTFYKDIQEKCPAKSLLRHLTAMVEAHWDIGALKA
jgi:hypothetical protein